MNKTAYPLVLLLAAAPLATAADRNGGFNGPDGRQQVTAAQAVGLPDDTAVRLTGHLTKSLGDERYEFRDDTGTLIVEIDDDDWDGAEVTPDDQVELAGEIDYEGQELEIDVESVRLATTP
ncbi:MAG TPA: NirD/YgiW/YdeI family stress tolerance protein [Woeseiaceae bacterium]